MEEAFRYYLPSSEEDLTALWDEAIISFDTNCLLSLYRYSPSTRQDFLDVLQQLKAKGRLWICHRVGEEFFKNRQDSALEVRDELIRTKTLIQDAAKHVKKVVKEHQDREGLLKKFSELRKEIESFVDSISATGLKEPNPKHDKVLQELLGIFNSNQLIGRPYTSSDLASVCSEGRERYAQLVPPGYRDASKPEPDRYGDLIIWKQLIEHAKHHGTGIIFVTNDAKDDWWFGPEGMRLPQPKLRTEFREATDQDIWFYSLEDFLRQAEKRLKVEVSERSLEEVREEAEEGSSPGPPSYQSSAYPTSSALLGFPGYQSAIADALALTVNVQETMKSLYPRDLFQALNMSRVFADHQALMKSLQLSTDPLAGLKGTALQQFAAGMALTSERDGSSVDDDRGDSGDLTECKDDSVNADADPQRTEDRGDAEHSSDQEH